MDEKEQQRVCPVCGSTQINWLRGGNLGDQYKCEKCNYQGIAVKGDAKFIKKLQENNQ